MYLFTRTARLAPGKTREALAWANLVASIVLTLLVWTVFVWMA